jgi:putative ABC transport system substrate-binding protein
MRRREFITVLGGAAAWPVAARAQERAMPVIGLLNNQSADVSANELRGFYRGLKEAGYVESENVAIEYRWADNQVDRLPALAADLVRRQAAVIVATGHDPTFAAKATTTSIPIVFVVGQDPVSLGLVASLNRPGGNATGVNFLVVELVAKRLEVLRDLVPGLARVAVLINPASPVTAQATLRDVEAAAPSMGLHMRALAASNAHEIEAAFEGMALERPDALFVSPGPFFTSRRVQLAQLTARHAIPAIYGNRQHPDVGGLISYGASVVDAWRQAGAYAGRILKGTRPADLPVMQASKFELVINAATARMLGLAVPPLLLARADEVIE